MNVKLEDMNSKLISFERDSFIMAQLNQRNCRCRKSETKSECVANRQKVRDSVEGELIFLALFIGTGKVGI